MRPEIAIQILDKCAWMTLGCKSYFYSKLFAWQNENSSNSAISTLHATISSNSVISSDTPIVSSIEILSQAAASEIAPAKKSPSFLLANVLKCSGHAGQYILNFYDTHKKFSDQTRKDMTDIIVRYAHDNNISFTPPNTLSIIKQIIKTFPTETEVIICL